MEPEVSPARVPVRVVDDPRSRLQALASFRADRPARSGTTIELALRNGRMLRVSEVIVPEALGRLAPVLDD
jgi:hypothetical protein